MGDEMFYRYQASLIDEATTTLALLLQRSANAARPSAAWETSLLVSLPEQNWGSSPVGQAGRDPWRSDVRIGPDSFQLVYKTLWWNRTDDPAGGSEPAIGDVDLPRYQASPDWSGTSEFLRVRSAARRPAGFAPRPP